MDDNRLYYHFKRDGLADILLKENHLLVAGTTGSGKSTFLDILLNTLCTYSPSQKRYAIIDQKKISVVRWEHLPHCMEYARTPETALSLIKRFELEMDNRFDEMLDRGIDLYDGTDFYLIIDEAAVLLNHVKEAKPILIKIMEMGRAARIHVVYCTQDPSRKTLDHAIVQNCDAKLALRCESQIESRQIIGVKGAEDLPRYGVALMKTPDYIVPRKVKINKEPEENIQNTIEYWKEWQRLRDEALRKQNGFLGRVKALFSK